MANEEEFSVADALAVVMAAGAQRAAEQAEERRRALLAEYGPDLFERGDVLIFRPDSEESDQETRVAVKIGPDRWTLTARGSSRTWIETLELAGTGHRLAKCSNEIPVKLVIGLAVAVEAP